VRLEHCQSFLGLSDLSSAKCIGLFGKVRSNPIIGSNTRANLWFCRKQPVPADTGTGRSSQTSSLEHATVPMDMTVFCAALHPKNWEMGIAHLTEVIIKRPSPSSCLNQVHSTCEKVPTSGDYLITTREEVTRSLRLLPVYPSFYNSSSLGLISIVRQVTPTIVQAR
jgi:hypothetical protein